MLGPRIDRACGALEQRKGPGDKLPGPYCYRARRPAVLGNVACLTALAAQNKRGALNEKQKALFNSLTQQLYT